VTLSPSLIPLPLFHPLAPRPLALTHPSLHKPLPPLPWEDAGGRGDGGIVKGDEKRRLVEENERCLGLVPLERTERGGGGGGDEEQVGKEDVLVEEFSVCRDQVWARMPGMHPPHVDADVSQTTRSGEDVEMPVDVIDRTLFPTNAYGREETPVRQENGNDVSMLQDTKGRRKKKEKVGSLGIYFDYCFTGMADASDSEECACSIKDSDDEDLLAKIEPMFPERPDNHNGDKSKGDGESLRSESSRFYSLSESADWPSARPAQAALSNAQTESRSLGQSLRRVDPAANLRNLKKRYDPDAESAYSRSICGSSTKGLYQLPRLMWQESDAEGHSQGCINQAGYSSDGESERSLCGPLMPVRDV
ncbi:MAG: hypothetical protein Q9174_001392, partial [Haloplaca sp. 1 TL-2023]